MFKNTLVRRHFKTRLQNYPTYSHGFFGIFLINFHPFSQGWIYVFLSFLAREQYDFNESFEKITIFYTAAFKNFTYCAFFSCSYDFFGEWVGEGRDDCE